MGMREKLIELIQSAVGGCATYWASLIADHLIANGVTIPVRCKDCKYCVVMSEGMCCNRALPTKRMEDITFTVLLCGRGSMAMRFAQEEKGEQMYKSPIDILVSDIQHQIAEQQDEEIYKAVVSVGINVDKEELIRALAYDRHQYMKGHMDGVAEATPRWIPVTDRLPERFVYVLAMTDFGEAAVARLKGNGRWYIGWDNDRYEGITHWMPLPEPPKGE